MYLSNPEVQEIVRATKELNSSEGRVVFIVMGEKSTVNVPELISGLNDEKINFFGGIFPGVIYDEKQTDSGVVLESFPVLYGPYVINDLDRNDFQLPEFTAIHGEADKKHSALILVDGLTGNIADFLSQLFSRLARSVNYFGGGAGSISLEQKPCLFSPQGFFQDAAIVTFLALECKLGVRHGWERIMGPLVATKTSKNRVIELNWQKAYDVYREIVEDNSEKKFTANNFFDIAKGFPFGMLKDYVECVVRDPIAVGEEGELICVGEVPENSVLDILKGTDTALIEAAGQAAADCMEAKGEKITHTMVIDCISRVLFLEKNFPVELKKVKQNLSAICEDILPFGMLTLGEISSYGEGYLEFFNKTIVTGVFYE
ncbi:FIST signal transduction protein [Candidatus Contubernalis alkaliaceticus]|uniref:FIST signal transduction protein n=1 Tax=Candidatus Contubernalis alkaliaceticus TaxID=338645 RepID=UPI001F4C4488|nr:FIST N-terminal domain-containing protein [Candidatus Contubernalis alkalaceticus]UNC92010.1 FIST C-terminal domain-containing protein [Candidatus Contubernalis alkalaceticus]